MVDYSKRPGGGAPAGPVSLSKRGEAVQLTKQTGGQPYRFNLNWNAQPQGGGGLFRKRGQAIDLDLGSLYELDDGEAGVVQAVGQNFGALDRAPFIMLDADDRSGTSTEGENLFISSQFQDRIRRMVVFAWIYEGVANWSQAGGVATIHQPGAAPITIALDEHRDGMIMCAIASLTNGPGGISLTREVQYFADHPSLDRAFDWGLTWGPGSK